MPKIAKAQVTVMDEKGAKSTVSWYHNIDNLGSIQEDRLIELVDYFSECVKRLDSVLLGKIVNTTLTINVQVEGLKFMPAPNSDVEEKCRIVYPTTAGFFRHDLPTFDHSVFVGEIMTDITDIALESLIKLWIDPTDAPNWPAEYGTFTDIRGEEITRQPTLYKVFVR